MVEISRLNSNDTDFWTQLEQLRSWDSLSDERVTQTVREIVHNIKTRGDAALLEYTQRFDQLDLDSATKLEVSKEQMEHAWQSLDSDHQEALEFSADRVRRYHEHQIGKSWQYTEDDGTVLGQKVTPLDRAGLYVPGGKASYPSSVIMNAIPAKVAGVPELIMVVPSPKGELNPMVLAAAKVAEVDRVFTVGGAQAVAALAYGTETIPAVDKIVGPGNIYVATAKAMVFGAVGIDMVAGPSEVLIICDGSADPDWVAMDLFSQAEHDEEAQSILIATDAEYIEKVQQSIDRLLPEMERATIIETSLKNRGAMILVKDLDEAAEISNYIAPEHLELSVEDAESLCDKIHNAGAIFMGHYTAEPVGDYCAGPNHVLPTSRTARFSSPLGVYDFQKRSSIIMCSAQGAATLGKPTALLARSEGLTAHARSAEYRTQN